MPQAVNASFTVPPPGTSVTISTTVGSNWLQGGVKIWKINSVPNGNVATFQTARNTYENPSGSGNYFVDLTFINWPGDSIPGSLIAIPTGALANPPTQPKALWQIIAPVGALISAYMQQSGVSEIAQQALAVVGKIYALKAVGGTDYRTNPQQLVADATAAFKGFTDDELQAVRTSVWLQAMTGGASPTVASSGTPPVSASAALALQSSKLLVNYPPDTLMAMDVYLEASLVKQIFSP